MPALIRQVEFMPSLISGLVAQGLWHLAVNYVTFYCSRCRETRVRPFTAKTDLLFLHGTTLMRYSGAIFSASIPLFNESRFMLVARCGRKGFSLTLSLCDHLRETFQHVVFFPAKTVSSHSSLLHLRRRQTAAS